MKLYHYTSIDSFTKIWISGELLFHEYKTMNDLYERQKYVSIEIPGKIEVPDRIRKYKGGLLGYFFSILAEYKQISFSKDYNAEMGCLSPMMWGLYARNEEGVCMEFDSQRLFENAEVLRGEVSYKPVTLIPLEGKDFESEEKVKNAIERNKHEIFFSKHPHWQAENEYRVISCCMLSLPIKDALTCIYMQEPMDKTSELGIKLVQKLVKDGKIPIRFIGVREENNECKIKLVDLR